MSLFKHHCQSAPPAAPCDCHPKLTLKTGFGKWQQGWGRRCCPVTVLLWVGKGVCLSARSVGQAFVIHHAPVAAVTHSVAAAWLLERGFAENVYLHPSPLAVRPLLQTPRSVCSPHGSREMW